jgi:hypothetical protein
LPRSIGRSIELSGDGPATPVPPRGQHDVDVKCRSVIAAPAAGRTLGVQLPFPRTQLHAKNSQFCGEDSSVVAAGERSATKPLSNQSPPRSNRQSCAATPAVRPARGHDKSSAWSVSFCRAWHPDTAANHREGTCPPSAPREHPGPLEFGVRSGNILEIRRLIYLAATEHYGVFLSLLLQFSNVLCAGRVSTRTY